MDKIDYKSEYKDLYLPKNIPSIIDVPAIPFIMIDGKGNPNDENGEYAKALEILYGLSYTIKMSKMGNEKLEGYFEYVVPPLEGLWWTKDNIELQTGFNKSILCWTALIRQPEFVTKETFDWACKSLKEKKNLDASKARFEVYKEGLCVQCMHIGTYDSEDATINKIHKFINENNLVKDFNNRFHHELYLSDPRKGDPLKTKTVIRIPVKGKMI